MISLRSQWVTLHLTSITLHLNVCIFLFTKLSTGLSTLPRPGFTSLTSTFKCFVGEWVQGKRFLKPSNYFRKVNHVIVCLSYCLGTKYHVPCFFTDWTQSFSLTEVRSHSGTWDKNIFSVRVQTCEPAEGNLQVILLFGLSWLTLMLLSTARTFQTSFSLLPSLLDFFLFFFHN